MKRFTADTLGLPETGLPLLRALIHDHAGLSFDDDRTDMLAERVAPLVVARGFRTFLDFFYLLKHDDPAGIEWGRVMDALAVPETYFWREFDQVAGMVCHIVPELARRQREPIRIWSVPCASGEEPLTIAMALEEAGWFERAAIEIHGSDASPAAIARARSGRYRQRSMRALPPHLIEKYFSMDGAEFVPRPDLARRVRSWSVVNLLAAAELEPHGRSPIVFCRNAFIYFSPQAVKRVVETLGTLMPTPGFLCVGASESLLSVTTTFALEQIDRTFVYVKRNGDG